MFVQRFAARAAMNSIAREGLQAPTVPVRGRQAPASCRCPRAPVRRRPDFQAASSPRRAALALSVAAGLLLALDVQAAIVFTVDSTADGLDDDVSDGICHTAANNCSLRAAVMQANRTPNAGATIMLPAGTYPLTRPPSGADAEDSGDLNLDFPSGVDTGPTTIIGAGAAVTIIDGLGQDRVLRVAVARIANISGVSMINGVASFSSGGGILDAGALTLSDSRIFNCEATPLIGNNGQGGGIYVDSGASLSMNRVAVDQNRALYGGGIYDTGLLTISQSAITGNHGGGSAGGVFAAYVTLIDGTTISGNVAESGLGGGVLNTNQLIATNTTVSQNSATTFGGGMFNSGTANVYNMTVVYNQADSDADSSGDGAGIYNSPDETFNLHNSVVAGNYLAGEPAYDDCVGALGIYGTDKFSGTPGCVPAAGSTGTATYIDSLNELGSLQNNGGPTKTVALLPPSALIGGAVDCIDGNSGRLRTDQRGRQRPPTGNRCDVGAFEYNELFAGGFELPP